MFKKDEKPKKESVGKAEPKEPKKESAPKVEAKKEEAPKKKKRSGGLCGDPRVCDVRLS